MLPKSAVSLRDGLLTIVLIGDTIGGLSIGFRGSDTIGGLRVVE